MSAVSPIDYDAWYDTPRGRWIGDREFALLARLLGARPGETLLDVGCGTGYFSRRFAREAGLTVTGIDVAPGMLDLARSKASAITFVRADAMRLPFAAASFDHVVAVTSLCFVADEAHAVREMARVARRCVVLGLLGRHSLLWLAKRNAGSYAGARWHRREEARALMKNAGLCSIRVGNAVYFPEGGRWMQNVEPVLPAVLPGGGFLAISGVPCR
jgi:SAM-dependent methyltransferase